jgi:hypothetical protein
LACREFGPSYDSKLVLSGSKTGRGQRSLRMENKSAQISSLAATACTPPSIQAMLSPVSYQHILMSRLHIPLSMGLESSDGDEFEKIWVVAYFVCCS